MPRFTSLIAALRWRAAHQPEGTAFELVDDGQATVRVTYGELDRRARAVASVLAEHGAAGERALLLYEPGPGFVEAFLGCLEAGAVPIPAYPLDPARRARSLPRLLAIAGDARPRFALTDGSPEAIENHLESAPPLRQLSWLSREHLLSGATAHGDAAPAVAGDALAYLQYTSGSTAAPKGVMISHRNLAEQCAYLAAADRYTADSIHVTWVPMFHDLGLIRGVCLPLLWGFRTILMPPRAFLERPLFWLETIAAERGTHSGGPSFCFDLCVRKTTEEQRRQLDLSAWTSIYNSAEPIRVDTMRRFVAAFTEAGVRWESQCPAYGLAEATLRVSSHSGGPVCFAARSDELERHRVVTAREEDDRAVTLVGCGLPGPGREIAIVDPESHRRCAPDRVGEIWYAGPDVGLGYYRNPELSEATFRARLVSAEGAADEADARAGTTFLRTGDLGFVREGQLYVTGRVRDLIIVRGANHYPQDLESTAQATLPFLRPGCASAFARSADAGEELVLVAEVRAEAVAAARSPAYAQRAFAELQAAIARTHELHLAELVLIAPRSIPKTSSGKLQRRACRRQLAEGTLPLLSRATVAATASPAPADGGGELEDLRAWLVAQLAAQLGIPIGSIDPGRAFVDHGLDSAGVVELTRVIEEKVGRRLGSNLLFNQPRIDLLARYLAGAIDRPLRQQRSDPKGAVTIVGMSCRFPDSPDLDSFWRLLFEGRDAVSTVPPGRWEEAEDGGVGETASPSAATGWRWGAFIDDVDCFDHEFFGLSALDARTADPQQRLLLEATWHAFEDAGIDAEKLAGSPTGVYVGVATADYAKRFAGADVGAHVSLGHHPSIAANRISYVFDLRGPSVVLNTACSSSLVAVHYASRALKEGEIDLAIVGGVNLLLARNTSINLASGGFLSPTGRCRGFSAEADGYVRGEGVGVIILKRLQDLGPRDRAYASIIGSAVNQDGRSNGLTAPNGQAQEEVIRQALAAAGARAEQVGYVEAHGTGTPLGDPIEAAAIANVVGMASGRGEPCAIGSVKSNIGHLEGAAGIAGLIKVALCLDHGYLVPHLHCERPSQHIPFAEWGLATDREPRPLTDAAGYVAGVSSFGFGGTNAHVVLRGVARDAYSSDAESSDAASGRPILLGLSAKSPSALVALASRYEERLATAAPTEAGDICSSALTARGTLPYRLAVTGIERQEVIDGLIAARKRRRATPAVRRPIGFLFSGQGSLATPISRELYDHHREFRETIDACAEAVHGELERPLVAALFTPEGNTLLGRASYAQPALFAFQAALCTLWRSWGIEPDVVLGHSLGELAAAHAAGALSLEEGVKLVAARGRLVDELARPGGMVAVAADERTVAKLCAEQGSGELSIAALNAPRQVVVSGSPDALEAFLVLAQKLYLGARRLTTSHGFHSSTMDPVLGPFEAVARGIEARAPARRWISNLTGTVMAAEPVDPGHWRQHLREPVRFTAGLATALEHCQLFIEIGPHPVLSSFAQQRVATSGGSIIPTLDRARPTWVQLTESVGTLFELGAPIDFERFLPAGRRPTRLPAYPFERHHHWMGSPSPGRKPLPRSAAEPAWREVTDAVSRQIEQDAARWSDAAAYYRALEVQCQRYQWRALRELGSFADRQAWDVARLVAERGVRPGYSDLLRRVFAHLSDGGLIERCATGYRRSATTDDDAVEAEIERADRSLKATPILELIREAATRYASVLRGQLDPMTLLFPDGSTERLRRVYRDWDVLACSYRVMACCVQTLAARTGAGLRILELGAGTGATAARLLPLLPPGSRYTFTDISRAFFPDAKKEFSAYPFVDYDVLDLNLDPARYRGRFGSYQVVIATNVLHVTRSIARALEHVTAFLAPGGLLIAGEPHRASPVFDTTFGLALGQTADDPLRPVSPFLGIDDWRRILHESGFANVALFPNEEIAAGLALRVIVAESSLDAAAAAAAAPSRSRPRPALEPPPERGADPLSPSLSGRSMAVASTVPQGSVESLLHDIWRDVFGKDIDPEESFFVLGGDSILASGIAARAQRAGIQMRAKDVYRHTTLRALAAALAEGAVPALPIAAAEPETEDQAPRRGIAAAGLEELRHRLGAEVALAGVGPAQELVYWKRKQGSAAPVVLEFSLPKLDRQAFAEAWRLLHQRHATLRSCFAVDAASKALILVTHPSIDTEVRYRDLRGKTRREILIQVAWEMRLQTAESREQDTPPLSRVFVICHDDGAVALWFIEHALVDEWSVTVLFRELDLIYGSLLAGDPSGLQRLEAPQVFSFPLAAPRDAEAAAAERRVRALFMGFVHPPVYPKNLRRAVSHAPGDGPSLAWLARHDLTLSGYLHAAWALILAVLTGADEVMFRALTHARGDLGIEDRRIGCTGGLIFVREIVPRTGRVVDWLRAVQLHLVSLRELDEAGTRVVLADWHAARPGPWLSSTVNYAYRDGKGVGTSLDRRKHFQKQPAVDRPSFGAELVCSDQAEIDRPGSPSKPATYSIELPECTISVAVKRHGGDADAAERVAEALVSIGEHLREFPEAKLESLKRALTAPTRSL